MYAVHGSWIGTLELENCVHICVTEWADVTVWCHEDGAAGEDTETGGGQTEYRFHLGYTHNAGDHYMKGLALHSTFRSDKASFWVWYVLISEWSDEMRTKKCKRKTLLARSERKKKVALVSGKKKKILLLFILIICPPHILTVIILLFPLFICTR